MSKLTEEQKKAAKLFAEEKAALEFQTGFDAALAGESLEPEFTLVEEAGFIAGTKRVKRAQEGEEPEDE